MTITIRRVEPGDVGALARICFEAFGRLQERHGVERDFETVEAAEMAIGAFASRPDFAGFAAVGDDGRTLLGSNFLGFSDAVAGVGPITVRPEEQSRGVGRRLMLAVMDEATRRGIARVRLQQEAINTASMSLYTQLGFDWRVGCALMRVKPGAGDDARVRQLAERDLAVVEAISTRQYGHSRVNEVRGFMTMGMPGFVLQRDGRDVGYFFPGFLGHGFAEGAEDLAALVLHAARHVPPMLHKTLVPLSDAALHRALLSGGGRTIKLFNYMSLGPFEAPTGSWIPSIGL